MRGAAWQRPGYTLIELVTVMIAATVLLVSLASTVVLSTRLLESPPEDSRQWHDREIADRLAADLRYATDVDESYGFGFQISKPNAVSGTSESVLYAAEYDGLTRQVDSGPVINLDAQAPSHQFAIDGYTAPTYLVSSNLPRVRSWSTAASSGPVGSLLLDLPAGCKDGDLLVLVLAMRTPWYFDVSPADWNYHEFLTQDSLQMVVMYKLYDASTAAPLSVVSFPSAGMSAAIVAIENVDPYYSVQWSGSARGIATPADRNSHATPLEPTSFPANHLNVQLFAAVGDPWYDGALGLSSFTDVVQETAASGWWSYETSVAIAVRNGPMPEQKSTPRVMHLTSGSWAQVGLQLGPAP